MELISCSHHVCSFPHWNCAAVGAGVGSRKKCDVRLMAWEEEGRTQGHLWHILFWAEPQEINAVTCLISIATCLALDFEMYYFWDNSSHWSCLVHVCNSPCKIPQWVHPTGGGSWDAAKPCLFSVCLHDKGFQNNAKLLKLEPEK